ncbi:MAG: chromosome segregation protein SMC [Anaerolineae bacterium]|uniref:chromosome segregation protein SMC n=1 Tax=Promineifilum sp. TaxID=2664178 RepID=UPI001D1BE566|nr:chromosome segregation protein SMC [Anaerolineales bacterium]MCB8936762.1 chromosome segregation protein SMC [Promineifilum sp.]MCO5178763.1 chromosome segregation protein SMC [Promineifilum sp.]MCW5846891.1 chromosome segregation protein SMC [Anaerolineae bacterium]
MKLRKLSLQGYKTFASKTEFVFDSGITAIVGPNGSGKSNIADALRWVLGEQSYGTLRARRSADMIFAGSQQRARAGMAQATITLDNSDGWLPIDFTEVEIARRSFRSGENEYLINGRQVRLKDVAELLATSGLAERTYTIIGQGLVDQALSLRSDERRALFEEAAGITHYKSRRAETLRRLEETQRNLQRVHDILEELRPRLTSLKRQATRTRNYEQISADLRELLRVWYGYKWEQAKHDLRAARSAAAAAEHSWSTARAELLAHQGRIDDVQGRLTLAQQQAAELQSRRDRLRQDVETARRTHAVHRERRAALQRQISEAGSETPFLEQSAQTARGELEAATAGLLAARTELQTHQTHLQEFHVAFESHRAAIAREQAAVDRAESERRQAQIALAQAQGQLAQLRLRLEELANEPELVDPADEGKTTSVALESAATDAQQEVGRLQAARQTVNRNREADVGRLKSLRRGLRDADQQLNKLRNDLARQEERVAQLERRGPRAIQLEPEAVVGRLAGLIRIPRQYETAIVAALGERLAAWLVTDSDGLWRAVAAARHRREGSEARLLLAALDAPARPDSRPDVAGESGVIGWADDHVQTNESVAPLLGRLLGGVLLVKDAPTGYRLAAGWPPGYVAVDPEGVLIHGGGLVEVGAAAGDGILAGETRRRDEATRLDEMRATLTQRENELVERQAEIDRLQEQIDERADEERQLIRRETEAAQALAEARRQLDQLRRQREFAIRRRDERAAARAQAEARMAQAEATIADQTDRLTRLEASVTETRGRLAALPSGEVEQQQQSLRQYVATAQTILAGRQAVVDSRRATLNQAEGQLNRLRLRLSGLQEQLDALGNGEDETSIVGLEQELDQIRDTLDPLLVSMETDRSLLTSLQAKSAGLQRHAHDLESHLTQAGIRQTRHENQIEGLQERIRADLGLVSLSYDAEQTGAPPLPMQEIIEELPAVTELPPDIEENIHHYRGQLQRMGPVNPDAPTELQTTEERYDFLTQQVGDLTETDAQLRQVIAELDELTSKAFAKTVEEVNGIFDVTFQQLFGGGSGRLTMTDPDDPTSSGVEIIARLPNRREQGLALLSGGERSLTAAALIFSLLKVAPPPFCVLDEVDAALDEANVTRFRDVLRELGRHTQFILITHNRGTVQAANTLYGVSMQPDSSSQVISIKPEEYLRHA